MLGFDHKGAGEQGGRSCPRSQSHKDHSACPCVSMKVSPAALGDPLRLCPSHFVWPPSVTIQLGLCV